MHDMKNTLILLVLVASNVATAQPEKRPPVAPPPVEAKEVMPPSDIVEFPDVETEFKGGKEAMQKFIAKNIVYPEAAIENNIQGKVFVKFVVDAKGNIKNITVVRGAHPLLDEAAINVIDKMPRWKPGKYKGKKVSTQVMLPIAFKLD